MEEAQKMGLTNVWLECDSTLGCAAFTARTNVPWMLRNRWNACVNYCGEIRFTVTHIFREGNACADKLANLGFFHRESFLWYNRLPPCLFLEFFMNRYCSGRLTWDVFVRNLTRQLGLLPTGYLWIPAKKDKRAP